MKVPMLPIKECYQQYDEDQQECEQVNHQALLSLEKDAQAAIDGFSNRGRGIRDPIFRDPIAIKVVNFSFLPFLQAAGTSS